LAGRGGGLQTVKTLFFVPILSVVLTVYAANDFKIEQLQGAWWSDLKNPTADFAILGDEVWLDFDAQYHPCKVEGDILIFDLGDGEIVRSRIVSLQGDRLVLETPEGGERRTLTRVMDTP
jgi:hypothetical protein